MNDAELVPESFLRYATESLRRMYELTSLVVDFTDELPDLTHDDDK